MASVGEWALLWIGFLTTLIACMTNKEIGRFLKETAALIDLTDGNAFKARAFANAARTLERMPKPATDFLQAGTLTNVRGIGKSLAADIETLVRTGTFEQYDALLGAIPPGILDMLKVKGLGAKKVRQLWKALDITSLEELEVAARTGRLAEVKGFGGKMQEKVLTNVGLLKQYRTQRRYAVAYELAHPVLEQLRRHPDIDAVSFTGAMRRKMEVVDGIEIVVSTTNRSSVKAVLPFESKPSTTYASACEGVLHDGFPIVVMFVHPDHFGTVLFETTGSASFQRAIGTAPKQQATEEAIFKAVGLPWIVPELREEGRVVEAAQAGILPGLITYEDLHGNLHNHSTYSDGAHSLKQMADATRALGQSYLGICDHSRSLVVANGMPIERVKKQQQEIEALNAAYAEDGGSTFRIFGGVESDILGDGSLDYPEDILASFDFIVASIHTRFNMTEAEATERLIAAVANPYTSILGHPTGRLLLAREGYPINHKAVIEACAAYNVAIELNANPYRLDLDWRWIQYATERGVLIAINPDAHAMHQLAYMKWGVEVARKGWLTPDQCLNAMPLSAFRDWLAMRKKL